MAVSTHVFQILTLSGSLSGRDTRARTLASRPSGGPLELRPPSTSTRLFTRRVLSACNLASSARLSSVPCAVEEQRELRFQILWNTFRMDASAESRSS